MIGTLIIILWIMLICSFLRQVEREIDHRRQLRIIRQRLTNQALEICALHAMIERLEQPQALNNQAWFPIWVDKIKGRG